jgi:hypothetical protein
VISFISKISVVRKTLILIYQTTRRVIPKDNNLHSLSSWEPQISHSFIICLSNSIPYLFLGESETKSLGTHDLHSPCLSGPDNGRRKWSNWRYESWQGMLKWDIHFWFTEYQDRVIWAFSSGVLKFDSRPEYWAVKLKLFVIVLSSYELLLMHSIKILLDPFLLSILLIVTFYIIIYNTNPVN